MNEDRKKKAEKAAAALRAVGIESAGAEHQSVCVSPEDAMKLLLLTDKDRARLLSVERIRRGVLEGIAEVKNKVLILDQIARHTPSQCERGEHILNSYVTGGRGGHTITRCLVCSYKTEGWD